MRFATARRAVVATFTAAVAAAGILGVAATPANAATQCYPNSKSYDLPGKPDVTVTVQMCVQSSGSSRRAYAKIDWDGNLGYIGGKRFNSFVVSVRLEKNDSIKTVTSCDYTSNINANYSSSDHFCTGPWLASSSTGGWSGDGKVLADIADDGNGTYTWDLHGSALIS